MKELREEEEEKGKQKKKEAEEKENTPACSPLERAVLRACKGEQAMADGVLKALAEERIEELRDLRLFTASEVDGLLKEGGVKMMPRKACLQELAPHLKAAPTAAATAAAESKPKKEQEEADKAEEKGQKEQKEEEEEGVKLALCVGVNKYVDKPLQCCVNDAEDMAEKLQGLGYQATVLRDPTKAALEMAFAEWLAEAEEAGSALRQLFFYYSGHGREVKRVNYLEVSPGIKKFAHVEGVALDRLFSQMNYVNCRYNFVVLDACRYDKDNATWKKNKVQGLTPTTKGVNPASCSAPTQGQFLTLYACDPGTVAQDGGDEDRNSVMTAALLKHLKKGVGETALVKRVRQDVLAATSSMQKPRSDSTFTDESFAF